MKVVVFTGSRKWRDREQIRQVIRDINPEYIIRVGYNPVTKRPAGVDRIVYQEAKRLGRTIQTFPANWKEEGISAGRTRNLRMMRAKPKPIKCIAFWDGASTGTKHAMRCAASLGIPTTVIRRADIVERW